MSTQKRFEIKSFWSVYRHVVGRRRLIGDFLSRTRIASRRPTHGAASGAYVPPALGTIGMTKTKPTPLLLVISSPAKSHTWNNLLIETSTFGSLVHVILGPSVYYSASWSVYRASELFFLPCPNSYIIQS